MLALTLTAKETIVIDTPEGVVRVTLRPRPEWFLVAARPGQSLHLDPVTEAELSARKGAREWVVLESIGGRVRLRRLAGKHPPRPMAPVPGPGRPMPAEGRLPSHCHLVIEAPPWMRIWREPLGEQPARAENPPEGGVGAPAPRP
jgi:hypothetical protein